MAFISESSITNEQDILLVLHRLKPGSKTNNIMFGDLLLTFKQLEKFSRCAAETFKRLTYIKINKN